MDARCDEWPRRCYVLGCDLAQVNDYTALVAVERTDTPLDLSTIRPVGRDFTTRLAIVGIKRLDRGIAYPDQVPQIAAMLHALPVGWRRTELVVDRTGVGRAVYDIIRRSGIRPLVPVTITAGDSETPDGSGGWRVAKTELVSVISALLHRGDLDIPRDHPLGPLLAQELKSFEVTFTAAGHMTFAAGDGAHDDLVIAAALACWRAVNFDRQRIRSTEFLV